MTRRSLAEIGAVEWAGHVQPFSDPVALSIFAEDVSMAVMMLRPSMPGFPAAHDSVTIQIGKTSHTIRIGEAEQLLEATRGAVQRVRAAMAGTTSTTNGGQDGTR
jgi:hypothetical protein